LNLLLNRGAVGVWPLAHPHWGADMAVKAPLLKAPMAAPYSLTGWYIGANAATAVGQARTLCVSDRALRGAQVLRPSTHCRPAGSAAASLGYNFQINSLCWGLKPDIQGPGISDTPLPAG